MVWDLERILSHSKACFWALGLLFSGDLAWEPVSSPGHSQLLKVMLFVVRVCERIGGLSIDCCQGFAQRPQLSYLFLQILEDAVCSHQAWLKEQAYSEVDVSASAVSHDLAVLRAVVDLSWLLFYRPAAAGVVCYRVNSVPQKAV